MNRAAAVQQQAAYFARNKLQNGLSIIPGTFPSDLIFTPEQIVSVIGSPIENVRTQWPLVAAALHRWGILDRPTAIAAIATIGVEARGFWPIEEYRMADGSIPPWWHTYGGGWVYHGRGLIQLTHRDTYRAFGDYIGIDLVSDPDRVLEPAISAEAFAWFFGTKAGDRVIPQRARAGNWLSVRILVNGMNADGYPNGWADFIGYVRALEAR